MLVRRVALAGLFVPKGCVQGVRRLALVKPTTLRTASPLGYPQLQALGAARQTEVAVGTLTGTSIAYASIAGARKARLFTSSNCQED